MKKFIYSGHSIKYFLALTICIFIGSFIHAQQTKITDYVIFGGQKNSTPAQTPPLPPGYAVQLASSNNIQGGGHIGSYNLIQTTGSINIGSINSVTNMYSGGKINLANSNTVTGNLTAESNNGTVISIGSNAIITGNITANGNILVSGGVVNGTVTQPSGSTYTGPVPSGGNNIGGAPSPSILPAMPTITTFPAAGNTNISNNETVLPIDFKCSVNVSTSVTLVSSVALYTIPIDLDFEKGINSLTKCNLVAVFLRCFNANLCCILFICSISSHPKLSF